MSSKKKMTITAQNLVSISPIGPAQQKAFTSLEANKNLFLTGSAGTVKTFILLYWALKEVLDKASAYEKVNYSKVSFAV